MEFINSMYTKQITMSSSENQYKCEECGTVFRSQ